MNLPSHSHHRKIQDKLHKHDDEMKFTTFENNMNTMSSDEEHEHHEISHPSPSHIVRNREKKLSHHKNITFLKMEEKEHKIDSVAHHHHPRDPHQIPRMSPVHTVSPTHVKVKHTLHALPSKDVADPHDMVLGDAAAEHDRISLAHSPSFCRKRQNNEMRHKPHNDIPALFRFDKDATQVDTIKSYPHARDLTYVHTFSRTLFFFSFSNNNNNNTGTIIMYTITNQVLDKLVEKQQNIFTLRKNTQP